MAAQSLPAFFFPIFGKTREEPPAFWFFLFGNPGIGGTAYPRGAIVLKSPVAAKEMSALGSLVGATDKNDCRKKEYRNYKFRKNYS